MMEDKHTANVTFKLSNTLPSIMKDVDVYPYQYSYTIIDITDISMKSAIDDAISRLCWASIYAIVSSGVLCDDASQLITSMTGIDISTVLSNGSDGIDKDKLFQSMATPAVKSKIGDRMRLYLIYAFKQRELRSSNGYRGSLFASVLNFDRVILEIEKRATAGLSADRLSPRTIKFAVSTAACELLIWHLKLPAQLWSIDDTLSNKLVYCSQNESDIKYKYKVVIMLKINGSLALGYGVKLSNTARQSKKFEILPKERLSERSSGKLRTLAEIEAISSMNDKSKSRLIDGFFQKANSKRLTKEYIRSAAKRYGSTISSPNDSPKVSNFGSRRENNDQGGIKLLKSRVIDLIPNIIDQITVEAMILESNIEIAYRASEYAKVEAIGTYIKNSWQPTSSNPEIQAIVDKYRQLTMPISIGESIKPSLISKPKKTGILKSLVGFISTMESNSRNIKYSLKSNIDDGSSLRNSYVNLNLNHEYTPSRFGDFTRPKDTSDFSDTSSFTRLFTSTGNLGSNRQTDNYRPSNRHIHDKSNSKGQLYDMPSHTAEYQLPLFKKLGSVADCSNSPVRPAYRPSTRHAHYDHLASSYSCITSNIELSSVFKSSTAYGGNANSFSPAELASTRLTNVNSLRSSFDSRFKY